MFRDVDLKLVLVEVSGQKASANGAKNKRNDAGNECSD